MKENEKLEKYLDIAKELKKLWDIKENVIMTIPSNKLNTTTTVPLKVGLWLWIIYAGW